MSSVWSFFPCLARSEFSKLSVVFKMFSLCILPPLSSPFFLPPASSISPPPCCYGLSLCFSYCHPLLYLSRRLLPTLLLPPAFSLAARLIHFIVCSLQVYPRKSTPAVDRLCVGIPAAEVSQMLLNHIWGGGTFQAEKFLDFLFIYLFLWSKHIKTRIFSFILFCFVFC